MLLRQKVFLNEVSLEGTEGGGCEGKITKRGNEREREQEQEQEQEGKRMGANLPLEALLQSENSRVNSILKLNIIIVALLQKSLSIDLLPI